MAKLDPIKPLYVAVSARPKPCPRKGRHEWLTREKARAREVLVATLAESIRLPHVDAAQRHRAQDAMSDAVREAFTEEGRDLAELFDSPEERLTNLEWRFRLDHPSADYERSQWAQLERAEKALDELIRDMHGVSLPSKETMSAMKRWIDQGADPLAAPAPVYRMQAEMLASAAYEPPQRVLDALYAARDAVLQQQHAVAADRGPTLPRLASSASENASRERLARLCLAEGLGPRAAAMVEALRDSREHGPTKPAQWFDDHEKATKRWRQTYERLAVLWEAALVEDDETAPPDTPKSSLDKP